MQNADRVDINMIKSVVQKTESALCCENPLLFANENMAELISNECYEIIKRQFPERVLPFDAELRSICKNMFENCLVVLNIPMRSLFERLPNVLQKRPRISEHLKFLRNIKQPEQRSDAWYNLRNNLITASNGWMAFGSEANIRTLLKEKVEIKTAIPSKVNYSPMLLDSTPFEWGKKYEPISTQYYEMKYNTDICEYGCLVHPKYSFLGASPDGINCRKRSGLMGRMLEIKNPVTRVITGIPKKEYWTQMQLQMEVCDLNECDFLETKFVEYTEYDDYLNARNAYNSLEVGDPENFRFGTIIVFIKDGVLYYEYSPFGKNNLDQELKWVELVREKAENDECLMWYKTVYWQLVQYSCVMVQRNKLWFSKACHVLEDFWRRVVYYRTNPEEWTKYNLEYESSCLRKRPRLNSNQGSNIQTQPRCMITIRGLQPPYSNDDTVLIE